jgi:hypothetical protein
MAIVAEVLPARLSMSFIIFLLSSSLEFAEGCRLKPPASGYVIDDLLS